MISTSRYSPTLAAVLTVSTLSCAGLAVLPAPAVALSAPDGWRTARGDGGLVMTPPDVPSGEAFTLTLTPEAPLGSNDLRSWMESRMNADSARLGTVTNPGKVTYNEKAGFYLSTLGIRTSAGSRLASYIALNRPGGKAQIARIVCSPNKSVYMTYMRPAMAVVMTLARPGMASAHSSSSGGSSKSSGARPPWKEVVKQYTTQPGAGVKPSEIAGIFIYQTMEGGVGGYMYVAYEPLIAFKDGTYYQDFDVPPADFNAAAARRLRPKMWGRWRRVGGVYQTYSEKRGWEKENWLPAGAGTGVKLSGLYSHLGGGGNTAFGGSTVISYVNEFTFHPDGRFEGGGSSGLSSPNVAVSSERKSSGGAYQIDGYTITLRYRDGHTERRSFALADPKKRDMIYMNGTSYLLKD